MANDLQNDPKTIEKVEEIKQKLRLSGFNAIFCVSSIEAAKRYYTEFKRQMNENPSRKLKIATIFSYAANEEENDGKNEITNTARAHNVKESCAGWRGSFRGEGFEAESDLRTRPGAVKGCGEEAHRRQNETTKR